MTGWARTGFTTEPGKTDRHNQLVKRKGSLAKSVLKRERAHGERPQQVRTASIRIHELDVTVPLRKQADVYRRVFDEAAAGPAARNQIPFIP